MLRSRVEAEAAPTTLLQWLVQRFRYLDANGWRAAIAAGQLQRNGQPTHADELVHGGDEIAFTPIAAPAGLTVEVPVLHADDDLVVVDKPPHLVVQTAGAFVHNTFVAALSARFPRTDGAAWLEPAHRLDRETSGVLVLVRHRDAARALQAQFERGEVHKRYLAVVHGNVATGHLIVDAPIRGPERGAAVPRSLVVTTVGNGSRRARTEARVEQQLRGFTVLQVTPHTGRRHQIRAHLAHAGHPLVGDKLYGQSDARYLAYVQHLKADGDPRWPGELPTARQLLHAEFLQLRHPRTGSELQLVAPRPHDLCAFVAAQGSQERDR